MPDDHSDYSADTEKLENITALSSLPLRVSPSSLLHMPPLTLSF